MIIQPTVISHEEYFSLFKEEKKHYFEYTKQWGDRPNYKVILHGFIKWDDEDACIWGGPFPGNYCLVQLFKHKSPLLPNANDLREFKAQDTKKYRWKDNIAYESYIPHKEKPWRVHLMGNDDASYSKVYGTKTHALRSINSLIYCPTNENLLTQEKFVFTN